MRRPIKEDFDTILDLFSGLDKKKIDIHLALNAVVRIRREIKALNKNLKMLMKNGIVEEPKMPDPRKANQPPDVDLSNEIRRW